MCLERPSVPARVVRRPNRDCRAAASGRPKSIALTQPVVFAIGVSATVSDLRDLVESCLERARDRLMIV